MFSQLFGKYLVEKSVITDQDYRDAIERQLAVRVKLGTIAIAEGLLTEEQVESINEQQKQQDRRFGDIAVEKGLLTAAQVDSLVEKQGNPYMQFLQVLLESGRIKASTLDAQVSAFQKDRGFSDAEMNALKKDDIDALIPILAVSARPHVTELVGLIVRNLNRFVTRDFYIERMKRAHSLDYRYLAGQKMCGHNTVYLALAEESDNGAFVRIASGFSGAAHEHADGDAYDAVCEFINVTNGLFASQASKREIQLDMEPAFAYIDQSVQGDFYILPVYLEDRRIDVLIAVDSEVNFGDRPFYYTSVENTEHQINPDSKGSVVLVDDSRMSRNMLRAIVEEAGYSVVAEAGNGEEAIEVYRQYKPDLITLDITMPKMDGIDALKKLKEIDPSVKAIMITAAGQQNKLIEALKLGAKRFITKPFEKDDVIAGIDDVMSH